MNEPLVWTFFYGSYINFDVLREVELVPRQWEVARLSGFDIVIRPRANLVRSESRCVYGIVATATHRELARLYAHAKDVLGETYLPEAVLVETGADHGWGMAAGAMLYLPGDVTAPGRSGICRSHRRPRAAVRVPGLVRRADRKLQVTALNPLLHRRRRSGRTSCSSIPWH